MPIVQIREDKFMSPRPSPGGRQGLQGQEDNSAVPMGKWRYRNLDWDAQCSSRRMWQLGGLFPLSTWLTVGSLDVMSNCWLLAEWHQSSSNCWVRLRRTGCHVQRQHSCFTRCAGTRFAEEHGHRDLFSLQKSRGYLAQDIYWEHCYTTGLTLATGCKKRTKLSFVLSEKVGPTKSF